jgi:hypothetical protein
MYHLISPNSLASYSLVLILTENLFFLLHHQSCNNLTALHDVTPLNQSAADLELTQGVIQE